MRKPWRGPDPINSSSNNSFLVFNFVPTRFSKTQPPIKIAEQGPLQLWAIGVRFRLSHAIFACGTQQSGHATRGEQFEPSSGITPLSSWNTVTTTGNWSQSERNFLSTRLGREGADTSSWGVFCTAYIHFYGINCFVPTWMDILNLLKSRPLVPEQWPPPTAIVCDTRGGTLIPGRQAVQAPMHQKWRSAVVEKNLF